MNLNLKIISHKLILTLLLLKIMKFSTSKKFISYEISKLNTHETKIELKYLMELLWFTDRSRAQIFCQ